MNSYQRAEPVNFVAFVTSFIGIYTIFGLVLLLIGELSLYARYNRSAPDANQTLLMFHEYISPALPIIGLALLFCFFYFLFNNEKSRLEMRILIEGEEGSNILDIVPDVINDLWNGEYVLKCVGDDKTKAYLASTFYACKESQETFQKIRTAIAKTGLTMTVDDSEDCRLKKFANGELA